MLSYYYDLYSLIVAVQVELEVCNIYEALVENYRLELKPDQLT